MAIIVPTGFCRAIDKIYPFEAGFDEYSLKQAYIEELRKVLPIVLLTDVLKKRMGLDESDQGCKAVAE